MVSRAFVLGFHGCDLALARRVVAGEAQLRPSSNLYDWLGSGLYFWEDSPARGLRWAQAEAARDTGKIRQPAVLGAVSSVSWLYASFVGVARLIAPQMTFLMFFGLYAVMLIGAIGVAMLFMRDRLARMIEVGNQEPEKASVPSAATANDNTDFPVFLEVEVALAAVGHAHNRLLALRNNFNVEKADLYAAMLEDTDESADSQSNHSSSIHLLKTAAA